MTVHRWNESFPLAVNSILKQSYTNLELIIVDDSSDITDVKKYDALLTDSRIKRIRMEKNSGTYACRNMGMDIAVGDYVTFADSDDWNHPDRITNSIKILEQNDADIVMGRFVRVDEFGNLIFNGSKISQFCLVGVFIRMSAIKSTNFDLTTEHGSVQILNSLSVRIYSSGKIKFIVTMVLIYLRCIMTDP